MLKSVKAKLALFLSVFLMLIFTAVGFITYNIAYSAVVQNIRGILPEIARSAAMIVASRVEAELNGLEVLANNYLIRDTNTDWQDIKQLLDAEVQRGGYIKIGIADRNGNYRTTAGESLNISDREFFVEAINGSKYVSDPMESESGGLFTITFAVPIQENNQIRGVLVGVKDGTELISIIDDIVYYENGSTFMINDEGTTIAHKDRELVVNADNIIERAKEDDSLSQLAYWHGRMISGRTGVGEYEYEGVEKYIGFAPVAGLNWSIGATVPKQEILGFLEDIRINVAIATNIVLLVTIAITYLILNGMTKTLRAVANHLPQIASGDLTVEIPDKYLKKEDETGILSKAVKRMQDSFKYVISMLNESINKINMEADNLSKVSEELASSSENVAGAIQDVAQGANSQAQDLSRIMNALTIFGNHLDEIVQEIDIIDRSSDRINEMANTSNRDMQRVVEAAKQISIAFDNFKEQISGFGESVKQIDEISSLINVISEQTNMLALNASIEASRAGEAGKGFAVVANQIRQLAERSKSSAANINKLIRVIAVGSSDIIRDAETMQEKLSSGITMIENAVLAFRDIIQELEKMTPEVHAANDAIINLDREKDSILKRIEEISAVAQEVSASSEEIAASSEEMNASSEEVAAAAYNLKEAVGEIAEQINKFKI